MTEADVSFMLGQSVKLLATAWTFRVLIQLIRQN